mmetsp:Transcript_8676/g.24383  ORF Transcript_8676/g.24383 Transcript_8676/m.24383 type:complete len:148 (-) Transcript_8676:1225-1668(-)
MQSCPPEPDLPTGCKLNQIRCRRHRSCCIATGPTGSIRPIWRSRGDKPPTATAQSHAMVASLLRGLSGVSAGGTTTGTNGSGSGTAVPPLGTAGASSVGTSVDGEFVAERRPPLRLPATSAATRTTTVQMQAELPDAVIILANPPRR